MEPLKAIVLAAGKGTRLRTEGVDLPKVLREANGKPLLHYVLQELSFLSPRDILLVIGYGAKQVTAAFPGYPHAYQSPQLGTGHAVQCAQGLLENFHGDILIGYGDMPLMRRAAYEALLENHRREGNVCTLLAGIADPSLPYGRILRDEDGRFARIVEDRDCTPEERDIPERNAGIYVFQSKALWRALTTLRPNNAQGEYYLTDAPAWLSHQGEKVGVCTACTPEEMLGVNTPEQLVQVETILKQRERTA